MKKRPGFVKVKKFRPESKIVGLAVFKDVLMVATETAIYSMDGPYSVPKEIEVAAPEKPVETQSQPTRE